MFGLNPYSPYGYPMPGSGGPQSIFPGQGMNQPSQPVQAVQSGPDWVMAPTVKDVDHVNVSPGGKAWVMVQNEPVFALRTADQMGLVTTAYYRFEKYDPAAQPTEAAPSYITREELEQRLASFADSLKPQRAKKEAAE